MKMPNPFWEATYSSSRRKHSHRCQCCRKIIQEGEAVIMAKVVGRATRAMHVECSSRPFAASSFIGREFLEAWGMEYLAGCGWREAKAFVDASPLFRSPNTSPSTPDMEEVSHG